MVLLKEANIFRAELASPEDRKGSTKPSLSEVKITAAGGAALEGSRVWAILPSTSWRAGAEVTATIGATAGCSREAGACESGTREGVELEMGATDCKVGAHAGAGAEGADSVTATAREAVATICSRTVRLQV